jgi:hypothetical protein
MIRRWVWVSASLLLLVAIGWWVVSGSFMEFVTNRVAH